MKGYHKLNIRPGAPELAARRKRREEEARALAALLAARKDATEATPASVTAESPMQEAADE